MNNLAQRNCLKDLRAAALLMLLSCAQVSTAQSPLELLPNLEAVPAYDLQLVQGTGGGTMLRFSTFSWNNGQGPLELAAGETGSRGQNVYQVIYLDDGSSFARLAGTFVWHPEHGHIHFENYATYTLQPAGAPGGSARTSSKTTFCVMDTDLVDGQLQGAPSNPVYATCDANIQGMSVGWGDEYASFLAGQSIDVTGVPAGDYNLTIEVDPKNRLDETNEGDNVAVASIYLDAANGIVDILDDGDVEVSISSITPNSVPRRSVSTVIVSGSGFESGMDVSFANGSGPRPSTSDVVVNDATRITATVTVKKGGGKRARKWDVRVGSAVLPAAFTVLP